MEQNYSKLKNLLLEKINKIDCGMNWNNERRCVHRSLYRIYTTIFGLPHCYCLIKFILFPLLLYNEMSLVKKEHLKLSKKEASVSKSIVFWDWDNFFRTVEMFLFH